MKLLWRWLGRFLCLGIQGLLLLASFSPFSCRLMSSSAVFMKASILSRGTWAPAAMLCPPPLPLCVSEAICMTSPKFMPFVSAASVVRLENLAAFSVSMLAYARRGFRLFGRVEIRMLDMVPIIFSFMAFSP